MAHQCPRCELLFSYRTEVEHHLDTDHRRQKNARTARVASTPVDLKKAVAPREPAPS